MLTEENMPVRCSWLHRTYNMIAVRSGRCSSYFPSLLPISRVLRYGVFALHASVHVCEPRCWIERNNDNRSAMRRGFSAFFVGV